MGKSGSGPPPLYAYYNLLLPTVPHDNPPGAPPKIFNWVLRVSQNGRLFLNFDVRPERLYMTRILGIQSSNFYSHVALTVFCWILLQNLYENFLSARAKLGRINLKMVNEESYFS